MVSLSSPSPPSGPRLRRLHADQAGLLELVKVSDLIRLTGSGNPPERYRVIFTCRGLCWPAGAPQPLLSEHHEVDLYLHHDYPRRPPQLVWQTDIFHPNILSARQGGGVCIGSWAPSESLADLVVRLGEMVQYRRYNPDDVLNREAAAWAEQHEADLPVDERPLAIYVL